MIEIWLDRRDDLDAARQRRESGGRRPGLQLIQALGVRIDRVLRDERRVVTQRLGFKHQRPVALPGGVIGLVGVLQCGTAAVDERLDAESDG